MQTLCQWLMVLQLVLSFFFAVRQDFIGRKASSPGGFEGFVGSVLGISVLSAIAYGAGCFTVLFGK